MFCVSVHQLVLQSRTAECGATSTRGPHKSRGSAATRLPVKFVNVCLDDDDGDLSFGSDDEQVETQPAAVREASTVPARAKDASPAETRRPEVADDEGDSLVFMSARFSMLFVRDRKAVLAMENSS